MAHDVARALKREDDPAAVPVHRVVLDDCAPSVREELDAAVGVVEHDVVADQPTAGVGDVDAVIVLGRRQPPTVVDAVPDNPEAVRDVPVPGLRRDADAAARARDVVSEHARVRSVDRRARQRAAALLRAPRARAPVQREVVEPVVVALEHHPTADRGALTGRAPERDPVALQLDLPLPVGAGAQAAGLAAP